MDDLDMFTGSDEFFRHWTGRLVYTQGVKYMAEQGGAYWLIDAIASYQGEPAVKGEEFQLWVLTVNLDQKNATLTCAADSGVPPLVNQENEFTDFPLASIKLYVENDVLMLPSER